MQFLILSHLYRVDAQSVTKKSNLAGIKEFKTGFPFSETGDETGFLRKKNGTKTERKRGENRISGSKIQFKAGKGTRNRIGNQEPEKETGIREKKSPGFLRDKSGTKNGTKKR